MDKNRNRPRPASQLRKSVSHGKKKLRQNSFSALPSTDEINEAIKELTRIRKLAKQLKKHQKSYNMAASSSAGSEEHHGKRRGKRISAKEYIPPLNSSTLPSVKDPSGTSFERPDLMKSFVQAMESGRRGRSGQIQDSATDIPDYNQNALKIWLGDDDITPIHSRKKKKKKRKSNRELPRKKSRGKRKSPPTGPRTVAFSSPSSTGMPKSLSRFINTTAVSKTSLGNYSAKSPGLSQDVLRRELSGAVSELNSKTYKAQGPVDPSPAFSSLNQYQSLGVMEEKGKVGKLKTKVYQNRKSAQGKSLYGLAEIHKLREAETLAARRIQKAFRRYVAKKNVGLLRENKKAEMKRVEAKKKGKNKKKLKVVRAKALSGLMKAGRLEGNTQTLEKLLKEKVGLRKKRDAKRKSGETDKRNNPSPPAPVAAAMDNKQEETQAQEPLREALKIHLPLSQCQDTDSRASGSKTSNCVISPTTAKAWTCNPENPPLPAAPVVPGIDNNSKFGPNAVDIARKKLLSDTLDHPATLVSQTQPPPPIPDTKPKPVISRPFNHERSMSIRHFRPTELDSSLQPRASTNREDKDSARDTNKMPSSVDSERPRRYTLQVPPIGVTSGLVSTSANPLPQTEERGVSEEEEKEGDNSESWVDEDVSLKVTVQHRGRCVKWNLLFPFEEEDGTQAIGQEREDPDSIQTEILAFIIGKNDVVAYKPLRFARLPETAQLDLSKWSHVAALMGNCLNIFASLSKSAPIFNIPTSAQPELNESGGDPEAPADEQVNELMLDEFVSQNRLSGTAVSEQAIDGIMKALVNIERSYPRCAADFDALALVSESATHDLEQYLRNSGGAKLGERYVINFFAMEMIEDCLREITHLFILIRKANGVQLALTKPGAVEVSRTELVRAYLCSQHEPIWGNVLAKRVHSCPKFELQGSFRLNLNQSNSRGNSEGEARKAADPAIVPHREIVRAPNNEEDALDLSNTDKDDVESSSAISVGASADIKSIIEPLQAKTGNNSRSHDDNPEAAQNESEPLHQQAPERDDNSKALQRCERNTFLSELDRRPHLEKALAQSVTNAYPFYKGYAGCSHNGNIEKCWNKE